MTDDIDRLVRDLGTVPAHAGKFVMQALQGTSMEAKTAWQEHAASFSRRGTLKHYPQSIDFDLQGEFPSWSSEIGPNLDRVQGSLGIVEDAPGGVSGPPQKARPAVISQIGTDFERGMKNAVSDSFRRADL